MDDLDDRLRSLFDDAGVEPSAGFAAVMILGAVAVGVVALVIQVAWYGIRTCVE